MNGLARIPALDVPSNQCSPGADASLGHRIKELASNIHLSDLRVLGDHDIPSDNISDRHFIKQEPRNIHLTAGSIHMEDGVEEEEIRMKAELLDKAMNGSAEGQGGQFGAGLKDEGEGEGVEGDIGAAKAREEGEGVGGGGRRGEGVEAGVPQDGLGLVGGAVEDLAGVGEGRGGGEGADGSDGGEGKGGEGPARFDKMGVQLLELGGGGEVGDGEVGGRTRVWTLWGVLGGGSVLKRGELAGRNGRRQHGFGSSEPSSARIRRISRRDPTKGTLDCC